MSDDLEITNEVKRTLLLQEMGVYKNTIYILETRHKVNKRLGNGEEILKPIETELEKHVKYLDALKAELRSLGSDPPDALLC